MSLGDFTANEHPSLGIELELALVDARHMGLRSAIDDVLAAVPIAAADRAKGEFLRCYVELDTSVCHEVDEAGRDLAQTIEAVGGAAEHAGVALWWGGTHPFSRWRDQEITPDPRYLELAEEYQEVVRRPVTFGLHIHVGVPSGDGAIVAMNRLAEHLPVLLALSANSPFWQGRATGLHSHRVDLLEAIPTGGLPPALRRWGEYVEIVESFTRSEFIKSPKELWWDIRPNPHYGTVEVRICDTPADLRTALALTALTQCLVAEPGSSRAECTAPSGARGQAIRQNRWLARRHGLGARLADLETGTPAPARELAKRLVDRLMPTAESLGCAGELTCVADLADAPSGAERQLTVFEETGDFAEVVRRGVEAARITAPVPAGGALNVPDLLASPALGLAPAQA
jgi:carboxylate-amine ligase